MTAEAAVAVGYVGGLTVSAPASEWSDLTPEGVNWCEISNDAGSTRVSGHSIYWLYPEAELWVMGGGSIGYTNPLGETLVPPSGNHLYREIDYLPDLPHHAVKLGHWWPGKERPPHG